MSTRILTLIALAAGVAGTGQAQVRKTICGTGCDYPGTAQGFFSAVTDAQTYQDTVKCVDYTIEIDPALTLKLTASLPNKACARFVTIRSRRMDALPPPGTRINPNLHKQFMPAIQAHPDNGSYSLISTRRNPTFCQLPRK